MWFALDIDMDQERKLMRKEVMHKMILVDSAYD